MMSSLVAIALACAAISFTITTTSIFKFFRDWVSSIHPKLDELIHCPWCFNHYVVFVAVLIGNPVGFYKNEFVCFIVGWFALVGLGGIIHYVLLRAYEPVTKNEVMRKLQKKLKDDKVDDKPVL